MNRTVLALSSAPQEGAPFFYLVRFSTFLIILVAVVDKNRAARTSSPPAPPPGVREAPSSDAGLAEN